MTMRNQFMLLPLLQLLASSVPTVLWQLHAMRKVLLPVYAQQGAFLAFNQLFGPLVVSLWLCASIRCSCGALLRCCSTMLLLGGKQLLSYACLKQDRPVLVMCFYCFVIEEEVWDLVLVKFQATGLKTLSSTTKVLFVQAGAPRLK